MADNYEQCTVEPFIPASALSEFERVLLFNYGFKFESLENALGPQVYLYAEEPLQEIQGMDPDTVHEYARRNDGTALAVLECANQTDAGTEGDVDLIDVINAEFPWHTLLQRILRKKQCVHILDFRVMGAYSCSKMQPGEFGGWVARITRATCHFSGTAEAYHQMVLADTCGLPQAFRQVLDLAEATCLSTALLPDRDSTERLAEARIQKQAIRQVQAYLDQSGLLSGSLSNQDDGLMGDFAIRCVVACRNACGEPDFCFVKVRCRQQQYENGDHYASAKAFAADGGYVPFLVYDEKDPAGKALMPLFIWQSASTVDIRDSHPVEESEQAVRTFNVHLFPVMRVKVEAVSARTHAEAIKLAENGIDLAASIRNREIEFTEAYDCYLVDEVGDDDFGQSRWYKKDGVTPLHS